MNVAVSTTSATVFRGQPVSIVATVTGAADNSLQWEATCGNIAGTGLTVTWTAPLNAGPCTVKATSALDATRSASTTLTVRRDIRVGALDDTNDGTCSYTHCSLREAIVAANLQPDVDTILITGPAAASSVFGMPAQRLNDGGSFTLSAVLPDITSPVHIVGPGADLLTISAGASQANPRRIFNFVGAAGTVAGMTLRNGFSVNSNGGAIRIAQNSEVALRNLRLVDNQTNNGEGGALSVDASKATLENVDIVGNKVQGTTRPGGGISLVSGSQLTMTGGRISNNEVVNGWGGGIRVLGSSVTMSGVEISGNTTDGAGGGAGMLAEGATTVVNLTQVSFDKNVSTQEGGGARFLEGATVTLTNSTFTNNEGSEAGAFSAGNVAQLTVNGGTISGNKATNRGGAVFMWGTTVANITNATITGNNASSSGGIHMMNTVNSTISGSTFSNNSGANSGGAVGVTDNVKLTLNNSTFTDNGVTGSGYPGGGLYASGNSEVTINGGEFVGNTTTSGSGAGIYASGGKLTIKDATFRNNKVSGAWAGGAILSIDTNSLNVNNSTFEGNSGNGYGGAIAVWAASAILQNSTFTGNSSSQGGAIALVEKSAMTAQNLTIRENSANSSGGIGVYAGGSLSLVGSEISNNSATNGSGGGVAFASAEPLFMGNVRVVNNSATVQGGGIQLVGGGSAELREVTISGNRSVNNGGGGITVGQSMANIMFSTISDNTAENNQNGGGLLAAGNSRVILLSSTVSGNSGGTGGGVSVTSGFTTSNGSTFVGNRASVAGAGISSTVTANVQIKGSLLSGNLLSGSLNNCATSGSGVLISQGYNLSDNNCAPFSLPSDKNNTPAGVSPTLANNGGPTFTHALLEGSAAINAGDAGTCLSRDQRGASRVGICDIGAFEFGGSVPSSVTSLRSLLVTKIPNQRAKAISTNLKDNPPPVLTVR